MGEGQVVSVLETTTTDISNCEAGDIFAIGWIRGVDANSITIGCFSIV